jgi:hypothetical protein
MIWKKGAARDTRWSGFTALFRQLTGELQRRAVIAEMQEADIVLAKPPTLRLSPVALLYRLLLQAKYVHSMLYVGDGMMVHTTSGEGVVIAPVPKSVYREDRYTILRAAHLTPKQRDIIGQEALCMVGMKLDHAGLITNVPAKMIGFRKPLMKLERTRLWCSKLILRAYSAVGVELVPPEKVENVTSEDLKDSTMLERI